MRTVSFRECILLPSAHLPRQWDDHGRPLQNPELEEVDDGGCPVEVVSLATNGNAS